MYHLQANTRRYRDLDLQRRNGVEGLVRFYIQSCTGKLVTSNCMMLKQFPILNSDIVESPCLFLLLLLFFDFFLFSSLFRQIVYKYVTCRTELIINVHACIWSTEQKGWEIQLGFRYTLCRLRTETVLHRKKTVNIVGTTCYFVSIRLANYTVLQYNIISFFNVCKFTKINSWDGHLSSTQTFLQSNRILRTRQPDITNFGYSTKPEVANYLNIDDELRQTYICTWDFDP